MIFDALIFHKLGHYLIVWIKKTKPVTIRSQYNGLRLLFEVGGVLMNFITAFLVILGTTLLTKEKYLANKDVIYGIQINNALQAVGFTDGDKIISVNGKSIEAFSDITKAVVFDPKATLVVVQRRDSMVQIPISQTDKNLLVAYMANARQPIFLPKPSPDSAMNGTNATLRYAERRGSFTDALSTYFNTFSSALTLFKLVLPAKTGAYKGIGGFKPLSQIYTVNHYLHLFALSSILLGLINLLPLPGLDFGNTLIALFEKSTKRRFDARTIKLARVVGSALPAVLILVLLFL